MESFKQYMDKDRGYLNPSLTIEEISRVLNTNRTYVSRLVNLYYGMTFRDYLNQRRLEYSKQLMNDEPDASLDYIASKSGFQSSTQFIRKFRETEGLTPTVWKQTLMLKKK
jgi:AraC-like DNA-binding protein